MIQLGGRRGRRKSDNSLPAFNMVAQGGGAATSASGAITLSSSAVTVTGNSVTMTATSSGDLSNGVYGIEFGVSSVGAYTDAVNVVGTAASQSITITSFDGVIAGEYLSIRDYYNINIADPPSTRIYSGYSTIIFISEFYNQQLLLARPVILGGRPPLLSIRGAPRRSHPLFIR